MNNEWMQTAVSTASVLAARKAAKSLFRLEHVLAWAGLERRHSHFWMNVGLVGAGASMGAVGTLLFAPRSGQRARRGADEELKRLREQARLQVRQTNAQVIPEGIRPPIP
jgi:hypothetical protein